MDGTSGMQALFLKLNGRAEPSLTHSFLHEVHSAQSPNVAGTGHVGQSGIVSVEHSSSSSSDPSGFSLAPCRPGENDLTLRRVAPIPHMSEHGDQGVHSIHSAGTEKTEC